ncbi:MAG: GNAT family N-acetyltransferase [Mycobacteriales bacterium]|nr:GNAT family N-acetyltransferase [Mycobacteriales bacterium]
MTDNPSAPVEITAGRWHLRTWQPWDAERVVQMLQDPATQRFTTVPVPYTREHAQDFAAQAAATWADGTAATWAVCDATDPTPLGALALRATRTPGTWSCGFHTAVEARGRGLMPDALAAACRWAFGELGAQRVEWRAHVGNWASRRVAEKAGFTVEGVQRSGLEHRGERVDCWVGARLPGDADGDTRALPAYSPVSDGVVTLRPWRSADGPDVARACDDAETQRWLPVPVPYTAEVGQGYVDELVPAQWADGEAANVAVTDASTGELLGAVGLKLELRAHGVGEVGYWVAPWARRRGVASRAARLHADWGHDALRLARVELLADPRNTASVRAAERAGFAREGVLTQARPGVREDARADMVLFASVR